MAGSQAPADEACIPVPLIGEGGRADSVQRAVQETGLAQVQLDAEGLETVVRVDRPAAVGERLLLRCAFTDARSGLYRLEEALPDGTALQYVGEEGEAASEEAVESSAAIHEADDRVAMML